MAKFYTASTNRSTLGSQTLVTLIVSGMLVVLGCMYYFSQPGEKLIPTAPATPHTTSTLPMTDKADYPAHSNTTATVFWAGEGADTSNDFIHNRSSAWMDDWVSAYGGIDDPNKRCGYLPCGFTPRENAFYFALPFSDYNENGLKPTEELKIIPWFTGDIPQGTSLLKNRWIQVTHNGKTSYGQWEDVGPFGEDDAAYVFGSTTPKEPRAALDLSPALADSLNIDGRGVVAWRFIEEKDIPSGPWKNVITRSNPQYGS